MGATPTFDLYIDDSGSRLPDKHDPLQRLDKVDAFALGGYLIKAEEIGFVIDEVNAFKSKLGISYPLHSHKIRCKKDEFSWLGDDAKRAKQFYGELAALIARLPILVTGCVIHRPGYNARYKERYGNKRWFLCKSSYQIIVERAAKIARYHERQLKVFVEECGKLEDRAIKGYHASLISDGLPFDPSESEKYRPLSKDEFANILVKNPKFVKKANPLVQLADLVLFPIIKGRYDPEYPPFKHLVEYKKIVDLEMPDDIGECGIKYYRFDGEEFSGFNLKKTKGSETRASVPPSTTTPGRN